MRSAVVKGVESFSCAGTNLEEIWKAVAVGQPKTENGLGYFPRSLNLLSTSGFHKACLMSASAAIKQAGWSDLKNTGLILATTTGYLAGWETGLMDYFRAPTSKADSTPYSPLGLCLEDLSETLQQTGPRLLVTSACAASTQAIKIAVDWLKLGKVDRVLVGGAEVLCELTKSGFGTLQLLSTETCRPFDKTRSGINLSEAAAFIALEKTEAVVGDIEILGGALASDANHMTAPSPTGAGSQTSMRLALQSAHLSLEDVNWIHAHGTGSDQNDKAEAIAIQSLFSSGNEPPWVCSTKAIHGHALGASGALETSICIAALRKNLIPASTGFRSNKVGF